MSEQSSRPPWWKNARGEWYVVLQIVLFAVIAFGPALVDTSVSVPDGASAVLRSAGFVMGAVGGLISLAGLLALGTNLSALPHPKDNASLVERGPYALVRHPIYSGLIIAVAGWALLTLSLLPAVGAVVIFVFFDIKSRREERWLVRKFPNYASYQRRVRKLIPFIY